MQGKQDEPTTEQYERLVALLEETNTIKSKTIDLLEQQIDILEELLKYERRQSRK